MCAPGDHLTSSTPFHALHSHAVVRVPVHAPKHQEPALQAWAFQLHHRGLHLLLVASQSKIAHSALSLHMFTLLLLACRLSSLLLRRSCLTRSLLLLLKSAERKESKAEGPLRAGRRRRGEVAVPRCEGLIPTSGQLTFAVPSLHVLSACARPSLAALPACVRPSLAPMRRSRCCRLPSACRTAPNRR